MNKNKKILFGILIALIAGVIIGVLTIKSPGDKGKAGLTGETINTVKEITKKQLSAQKPSDVVLNYFKALREKDYSKAAGYLSEEGKKRIEGSGISVEKAMESEAEENEKVGYTKVEIIRESAPYSDVWIVVRCSSRDWGCDKRDGVSSFNPTMTKEGNKWKIKSLKDFSGGRLLNGKIETHPSPGSPQWVALKYSKAVFNKNYSEAKKYLLSDKKLFQLYLSDIRRWGFTDYETDSDFYENFDKWYGDLNENLKEKIKNRILKEDHEFLQAVEVNLIRGVIPTGVIYIKGELKMCVDAYCDKFIFFIEKENNNWKIWRINHE